MSETGRRTADLHERRNRLETAKKRPRHFLSTPEGLKITRDLLFGQLANFLAGKDKSLQPEPPPKFLRALVRDLLQEPDGPWFLALAALAPLLDGIFRNWKRERERLERRQYRRWRKDRPWKAWLKNRIGDDLYWRLKQAGKISKGWSQADRTHAGNWLLKQALELDFFDEDADQDGFYCLSAVGEPKVAQVREAMIAADPSYAPHLKPPPPWTGFWKTYDDGFHVKFVRDWRPKTETAIDAAFLKDPDWEHARAVNALASVPLTIDAYMLDLVKQLGVRAMGSDDAEIAELEAEALAAAPDGDDDTKRRWLRDLAEAKRRYWRALSERKARGAGGRRKPRKPPPTIPKSVSRWWRALAKRKADQVTVAADVVDAEWCIENGPTFYIDYNCDKRGRLNPLQNLNFTRQDHVRAMFRFARGMKLEGDDPTAWLEIHCANCGAFDSIDKESWKGRRKWVDDHREDILAIALDPAGTFDKGVLGGKGWKEADKPFAFVAACRELAATWADSENFVTHLPIGFDGSANGLQHLSLLSGDVKSSAMTNLLGVVFNRDGDEAPSDVYAIVIERAVELIKTGNSDHAVWWRERFKPSVLSKRQRRNLLKRPIMTYAYSVTDEGATLQIANVYRGFPQIEEQPRRRFRVFGESGSASV
jgi:hypothetical protein